VTVRPLRSAPHGVPPLFPEGIVADRYRIIETIGVGGSATVFEAEDLLTGELVALKAIPAEEKLRRRARREMRAVSSLDHGAIVRMLSNAEDENYIFVSFELVRGNDLSVVLRERRLEESEILRAVAAVCDALEHAHARGVIHRDVKPGNILLREDGILKLTDFGIAQMDHPDATVDESLLGTLSYMAPEQVRGEMLTGSVDVWAAALVAYEALTRKNPYRSKNPVELAEKHRKLQLSLRAERPDLPEAATKMIDRALDLDNQRRPLPSQLRDALLRGAVAMERGGAEVDPSIELPPMEPRVRLRKRWLRAVPDLIDVHRERHEHDQPSGQSHVEERFAAALTRLQPHWPVALTGCASIALLGALPFYPTGWPFAIALLATIVSLRLPLLAGGLVLAAALPLLGNLAFGLVPGAALLGLAWVLLMARDGRRVLLPVLAPLCALCFAWSLYPLLAGSSPRAYIRGALGAAGALAMTLTLGLTGYGSPFSPTPQLTALGTELAGADDAIATAGAVAAAIGFGPVLLAVVWAALAVTVPLVLAASGRALLIATGLWLSLGTLATLAIPVVITGALFAPIPIVMGAGAAGIVIFVRSRSLDTAPVAAADSKSTGNQRMF
jgi:serine/threonine-protein kinase